MINGLRTQYENEVLTHHPDICAAMAYLMAYIGNDEYPTFAPVHGDAGQNERAGDPNGIYAFEDEDNHILLYVANTGACATIIHAEQGHRIQR